MPKKVCLVPSNGASRFEGVVVEDAIVNERRGRTNLPTLNVGAQVSHKPGRALKNKPQCEHDVTKRLYVTTFTNIPSFVTTVQDGLVLT